MADFSALFRRGGSTIAVTVADNFDPAQLEGSPLVIGGTGPSLLLLVSAPVGAGAKLSLPVQIKSASQSAYVTACDALDTFLQAGSCTLELSFTGSSEATIYDVVYAYPVQPAYTREADLGHYTKTVVELVVSPFVRKADVALYTLDNLTSPGYLSLSGMVGNYRSPLTMAFSSDTTDDLHSLYVAWDPDDYSGHLKDAKDLSWGTGFTDYADAAARCGTNATEIESATFVAASFDTAAYPAGTYRILARVKVRNGATGYIKTDATEDIDGVIDFTRSSWHIVEVGDCYLPPRKVRASAGANLTVSLRSSSAANGDEVCIDWVCPVPLDHGFFSWHHATDASDATTVERVADEGITYVDDVADEENRSGSTIMALGGQLLVLSENAAGDERTQALKASASYPPRYAGMR